MLIIDLSQPFSPKKAQPKVELILKPEPIQAKESARVMPIVRREPVRNDPFEPSRSPEKARTEDEEKARILRQLEDEDHRIRIQRSRLHQKYFELLTPQLTPKPGADFSDLYEQIDALGHQLQAIWIKRQQVEKYGALKETSPVTKEQLTQLSSLKYTRLNAYKSLSKWEKKLAEATAKNSKEGINNAQSKIDELELQLLDLSHQIDELAERVKLAR